MKIQFLFSVPFINAQPTSMVPAGLPANIDITAPYFKGIRPYKDYEIFDEMMRQSDRIGEKKLIKWMNRWSQAGRPELC